MSDLLDAIGSWDAPNYAQQAPAPPPEQPGAFEQALAQPPEQAARQATYTHFEADQRQTHHAPEALENGLSKQRSDGRWSYTGDEGAKAYAKQAGEKYQEQLTTQFPEAKTQAPEMRKQFEEETLAKAQAYQLQRYTQLKKEQGAGTATESRYLAQRLPFAGLATDAAYYGGVALAANHLKKGEADASDYALLGHYLASQQEEQGRGWLKKTGDVVSRFPAAAVEFAATGGGAAVGKAAAEAAVKKMLGEFAEKGLVSAAGFLGAGVARTALMAPLATSAGVAQRMVPEIGVSDQGVQIGEQKGLGKALGQTLASELASNTIFSATGVFGKTGMAQSTLGHLGEAMAGMQVDKEAQHAISAAFGEKGEGGVLSAIASGDPERLKKAGGEALSEFLGVSLLHGALHIKPGSSEEAAVKEKQGQAIQAFQDAHMAPEYVDRLKSMFADAQQAREEADALQKQGARLKAQGLIVSPEQLALHHDAQQRARQAGTVPPTAGASMREPAQPPLDEGALAFQQRMAGQRAAISGQRGASMRVLPGQEVQPEPAPTARERADALEAQLNDARKQLTGQGMKPAAIEAKLRPQAKALDDARIAASAEEALQKPPAAPPGPPEQPQGPEASAASPETPEGQPEPSPVEKAFTDSFPGGKLAPRGELQAEIAGKTVYASHDPERNMVRIDFEKPGGGVPGELRAGSKDFAQALRGFVERVKDTGAGIEYRAIDTNRGEFRTSRQTIYGRLLEKAGYEQVGGPGVDQSDLYAYRPKAEAPAPETAPEPPAKLSAAERMRRRQPTSPVPAPAPPSPPESAAKLEALARQARSGKRVDFEEIFDAAGLTDQERHAVLHTSPEGGARSFRDIANDPMFTRPDGKQFSHQTVSNRLDSALKKLNAPEDYIQEVKAQQRAFEKARVAAQGKTVDISTEDPDQMKRAKGVLMNDLKKYEVEIDKLIERHDKEKADAGGELPAEREQQFWDHVARLHAAIEGAGADEAEEPSDESVGSSERSPLKPTSLRRPAEASVPSGEPPPGPPSAEQGAGASAPEGEGSQTAPGGRSEAPRYQLTPGQKSLGQRFLREQERAAMGSGAKVADLHAEAADVMQQSRAQGDKAADALAYAREALPATHLIRAGKYEEPGQIPGFDTLAEEVKSRFPGLFNESETPDATLFRLLQEAKPKERLTWPQAYERALDRLAQTPEAEQARQGATEGLDASFDFGQQPTSGTAPTRPEPVDPIEKIAGEVARDQGGHVNLDRLKEVAVNVYHHIAGAVQSTRDNLNELAGAMAPRTTRADRETGEALTRLNAAGVYSREAAPVYIDKVMGQEATRADRHLQGTAFEEMRHRYAALAFRERSGEASRDAARARAAGDKPAAAQYAQEATEYLQKATHVTSFIGGKDSPLKTEADFRALVDWDKIAAIRPSQLKPADVLAAIRDPKLRGSLERWASEFVPVMEANYRGAEGMDDADPIHSLTQIPGLPINAKVIRGGEASTPGTVGTVSPGKGRGNVKNLLIGKYAFAREAGLDAPSYDTDLGAIIENSLSKGTVAARKAEFYRTAEANGQGVWAPPGKSPEGFKEIPFTRPPKGTQNADPGDVFHAKAEIEPEVRQGLFIDKAYKIPGVTPILQTLTTGALASTAEATYHAKNLLTFLTKPGVSPVDLMSNVYNVIRGDEGSASRLVELARIGALKEGGFESSTGPLSGVMESKYNPLKWMGSFLNVLDRSMRLTADDAFTRLAGKRLFGLIDPQVIDTETNRRDFINQLGQYNRRAQNELVVLLRDTGLGPFATAGTNYYMQGLRSLTMNPGVKATSMQAAVQLRAEMLTKTVAVLGATALANYLMWGRVDGDDKTPLGAIKVSSDPKTGRTGYFDLTNLTGLTRGMRETGLLALAEGKRKGMATEKAETTVENKAYSQAILSALHPAIGPGFQFGYTAATGKDTHGINLAEKSKGATDSTPWQKMQAALRQANPAYSALTGAEHYGKEVPTEEKVMKLAGPFGVQYRYQTGYKRQPLKK